MVPHFQYHLFHIWDIVTIVRLHKTRYHPCVYRQLDVLVIPFVCVPLSISFCFSPVRSFSSTPEFPSRNLSRIYTAVKACLDVCGLSDEIEVESALRQTLLRVPFDPFQQ
uniref:Uncharacterized protein n=1 Tax=Schistocephalus solidus TaxID=70667 RepID=A0A0V0J459_SCHSO